MIRYLTTYILLAFVMAGYLRGVRSLVPDTFKLTDSEITQRSITWPYSLGLIIAGWEWAEMAGKSDEEPEVETEEEYEVPSIDVRPSGELSV